MLRRILSSPYRVRIALIALAALAVGAWLSIGTGSKSREAPRTATVETGTVTSVVTAQGKLEPKEYVNVGLQVSGQIKKLHVEVSDTVHKDQLLAEVDPRIYQSRVEEDTAQVASLKAQAEEQAAALGLAEKQQARNREMYAAQAISKDSFEQGEAALKQARSRLASLKAQTAEAASRLAADKTNLEFTRIYAPMDGVVASLPVREGQTLNSVQSAPTLMEIDNLEWMTVRAQVAEADVPRITLGMPAYFTTLGEMEHKWKGTVRLIQGSPEIINDVVLYDVLIDVENTGQKLMNGMSVQVFFELGTAENVPTLPLEALGKRLHQEDDAKGKAYQVKLQGEEQPRTVWVGLSDRTRTEIKEGLQAGDIVVIPARTKAPNGPPSSNGMPPGMGGPKL